MIKNEYKTFFQLFNGIKEHHDHYIDYLVWVEQQYCYFRKSFAEVHEDIQLCYSNLKRMGITEYSVVFIDTDNSYEFLICDFAVILLGALSIISSTIESPDTVNARLRQFHATNIISKRNFEVLYHNIPMIAADTMLNEGEILLVTPTLYNGKDFSIVFSSGTSGFPKALGITEKGSLESSNNFFNYMGFEPSDQFMIYLPLANYQQRFFFWGCLMHSVNIALGDAQSLLHALKAFHPTILLAPPNFFYNLFCLDNNHKSFFKSIFKNFKNSWIANYITHKPIYETLGKKMHYLLTGMAPIDIKVLEYFHDAGKEIYQIYGQTEIGMIACNNKKQNKIGTVGQPIIKLYLSEENEIITESPFPIVSGYYKEDGTKDLLDMIRPTGDIGRFDEDAFLSINGRKNETIVLNNGVKINPIMIENQVKSSVQIVDMVIFKTQQENNGFVLNIVLLTDDFSKLALETIRQSIGSIQGIQANTNIVHIYQYCLKNEEKSFFYTENGKFSRVRAIDFFKTHLEKLTAI